MSLMPGRVPAPSTALVVRDLQRGEIVPDGGEIVRDWGEFTFVRVEVKRPRFSAASNVCGGEVTSVAVVTAILDRAGQMRQSSNVAAVSGHVALR